MKADSKYYLNFIELLSDYQKNAQLSEAVHNFNPAFDFVEPYIW